MKAGEIIAAVRRKHEQTLGDEEAEAWMGIIRRLGKDGLPEPRRLGRFLKKNAGRLVRGMRLAAAFDSDAKVERYYVEVPANPIRGLRDLRGFSEPIPEKSDKNFDQRESRIKESENKQYGANPGNPVNPVRQRWEAII
jgi:hypothetical protein